MRDLHWTFSGPGRIIYTFNKTWFQYPLISAPVVMNGPSAQCTASVYKNCRLEIYAWESENRPPPIDLLLLLRRELIALFSMREMDLKQVLHEQSALVCMWLWRWKGAHQSVLSKGEAYPEATGSAGRVWKFFQHHERAGCKMFSRKFILQNHLH